MFKKVLVPVSGENRGERTNKALQKAMELCDGELILLHVTEPIAQIIGGETRADMEREGASKGVVLMEPLIERLQQAGRPFHTRVVSGTPAETIVQVADEENVDLIVMFTDGRDGSLGEMLLGSITERVLRTTGRDLLAVRN